MKNELKQFQKQMKEGLEVGEKKYKGRYLTKSNIDLLNDIQEECRDIANYSFMLWHKVELVKNMKIFFVKCAQCKSKKFTNEKMYKSRVIKYKSVRDMEQIWICRMCKKNNKKKYEKS